MSTATLFNRLKTLQPPAPLLTGQITADLGVGLVRVLQPGGGVQQVRNPPGLAVGKWAFFQAGVITGEAPNLTSVRIEI